MPARSVSSARRSSAAGRSRCRAGRLQRDHLGPRGDLHQVAHRRGAHDPSAARRGLRSARCRRAVMWARRWRRRPGAGEASTPVVVRLGHAIQSGAANAPLAASYVTRGAPGGCHPHRCGGARDRRRAPRRPPPARCTQAPSRGRARTSSTSRLSSHPSCSTVASGRRSRSSSPGRSGLSQGRVPLPGLSLRRHRRGRRDQRNRDLGPATFSLLRRHDDAIPTAPELRRERGGPGRAASAGR